LTEAEVIHFRDAKYAPSVVMIYCYIKTHDPFGNGLRILPKQIAKRLKYHPRNVSRAINALVKAGELGLAIVEAHVKLVAKSVESISEIVSNLGLGNPPTPPAPAPPVPIPIVETQS
jgi:DNA-binding MarR family transcriptional regulator